jgi:hypothetical protein
VAAAQEVADEPVAVVVKEFPARELLEQLADLLEYRWSRRGRTGAWRYEIWQDLHSRQREEALRQGIAGDLEQRFRDEVALCAEMAALSQEQIEAIVEAGERRHQSWEKLPPEERGALLSTPKEREQERRFGAAERLWSPMNRALARLIGSLSESQWAFLRQDQPIIFCTDPRPGELRLPVEIARIFRASPLKLSPPWAPPFRSDPEAAERMRQREREAQEQWAAASGHGVIVWLEAGRVPPAVRLYANAYPIRGGAPLQDSWGGRNAYLHLNVDPVDAKDQQWEEESTSARRAALARNPVLGSRRVFHPEAEPRGDPLAMWRLQELLPDLARAYGIPLISDAYWSAASVSPTQLTPRQPTALFSLLDRLAGVHHRWDHRGDLVRLRSRTWFLDRPREIPLRVVRRWQAACAARGALRLEEYRAALATLNEDQLETVADLVEPAGLPADLAGLPSARHALRLYAALLPSQRRALWQGEVLLLGDMTPAQRELFMQPFQQHLRSLVRYRLAPPAPSFADGSGLALTCSRLVRTRELRGGVVRYRDEAPAAEEAPGKAISPRTGDPSPATREAAPGIPGAAGSRGSEALRKPEATRHPVVVLTFRFQYGTDVWETESLIVAAAP